MTRRLIQVAPGVNPGDAITNEIRIIDQYFRAAPYRDIFSGTEIYAEHIHPTLRDVARPAHLCSPGPDDFVLYHYGIAARITERVRSWTGTRKALIYHNVTPAQYYRPYSLYVAGRLERARRDLRDLRDCFDLIFADSRFNRSELEAFGFTDVRLLPVLFSLDRFSPPLQVGLNGAGPLVEGIERRSSFEILFVGRIAPNKGHADLIKIFYFLQRAEPRARLILAGDVSAHAEAYLSELRTLVRSLNLQDSVEFTGFVTDEALAAHYRQADVFVSASAHEGFCVPLLEAMRCDLPVVAYASVHSAVAETMADAGVLFDRLDYPVVAELVLSLLHDDELRRGVIERQRERVRLHNNQSIFEQHLYGVLKEYMSEVVL